MWEIEASGFQLIWKGCSHSQGHLSLSLPSPTESKELMMEIEIQIDD